MLIFTPLWWEIDIFYFKFGLYGKSNLEIDQSGVQTILVRFVEMCSFWTYLTRMYYLKENLAPHMTARYAARRTCWRRASFIGGIFFISLSFCVSKVCLVLFTLSSGICLSYIRMTNLSIVGRIPSMCAVVGVWTSVRRVHLTSSNLFYTDHAVRFPLPADFAKWLLM